MLLSWSLDLAHSFLHKCIPLPLVVDHFLRNWIPLASVVDHFLQICIPLWGLAYSMGGPWNLWRLAPVLSLALAPVFRDPVPCGSWLVALALALQKLTRSGAADLHSDLIWEL